MTTKNNTPALDNNSFNVILTPITRTTGNANMLMNAAIQFTTGLLAGLVLDGFVIWNARSGNGFDVSMPSTPRTTPNGTRYWDHLRAPYVPGQPYNVFHPGLVGVRQAIIAAYQQQKAGVTVPQQTLPLDAPTTKTPATKAKARKPATIKQAGTQDVPETMPF